MESASDRDPGSMPGISGEVAPASDTGRLAGHVLAASRWLPPIAVIALTLVAFLPVLDNGFIPNWDDRTNFLDNPHYRGLGGAQLRWMFTTFHAGHYIPLTWLSLGLDYLLWGLNPAGYHLSSLLLHAATALAFYFLALRLLRAALPPATTLAALRWGAAVAALVFAVHPLRVESVAWATERRDVLSGLFYVLALLCYVRAATASAETAPARLEPRWYALALACFAAALLSKSIVVTLPVTLLVLDVYPLRRLGGAAGWRAPRPWLDKLPFVALSAATTIVAFLALLTLGNTRSLADLGIGARIFLSVYGLAFYIFKTLAPLDLSPLYPLTVTITWWHFAVVIAATVLAVSMRRRWPAFTAAWLIYAITLGPVLGFFHNGPQAVADRYTYLACLGWALLIGAAAAKRRFGTRVVRALLCVAIIALCLLTWRQVLVWRSPVTLWGHAASLGSGGRAAHANLAEALEADGRPREAIVHYLETLRRSARKASWHVRLGQLYVRVGDDTAALQHFSDALAEEPGMREACDGVRALATRSAAATSLLGTCAGPR